MNDTSPIKTNNNLLVDAFAKVGNPTGRDGVEADTEAPEAPKTPAPTRKATNPAKFSRDGSTKKATSTDPTTTTETSSSEAKPKESAKAWGESGTVDKAKSLKEEIAKKEKYNREAKAALDRITASAGFSSESWQRIESLRRYNPAFSPTASGDERVDSLMLQNQERLLEMMQSY